MSDQKKNTEGTQQPGCEEKSDRESGPSAQALRSALLSHVSSVGKSEGRSSEGLAPAAATGPGPKKPPLWNGTSTLPTPFPEGASTVDYVNAKSPPTSQKLSEAPRDTKHQVGFSPPSQYLHHSQSHTGASTPSDVNPLLVPLTSPPSPQLHARRAVPQSSLAQKMSSNTSSTCHTPRTPSTTQTPASSVSSSRRNSGTYLHSNLSRHPSFTSAADGPAGAIHSKPDFRGMLRFLKLSIYHLMTTTPRVHLDAKIIVAMVGLPARGKSYLSNKLMRYLRVSDPVFQCCPGGAMLSKAAVQCSGLSTM